MNMNIALEQDQQQRVQNDSVALENQQQEKASLNTDLHSGGFFDGLIGCEPSRPEQHSYWEGYQTGYREYWAVKRSIEIPTEF